MIRPHKYLARQFAGVPPRDGQRRLRNRIDVLRSQGHPDSDDRAAKLESALDRINAVFTPKQEG
jgi:hypothetical protein